MTGSEIKAVLEDAINFFLDPDLGGSGGSYPFAAGLRYDIDYTEKFGNRISNIEMNRRLEETIWTSLDPDTLYVVVTNSFIALGKDGYLTFTSDTVAPTYENTYIEYGQSFINYVTMKDRLIFDPPLDVFSTQRIVKLDGSICDIPVVTSTSMMDVDDEESKEKSGAHQIFVGVIGGIILVVGVSLHLVVSCFY